MVYTLFFNNLILTVLMRIGDYWYALNWFKRWKTERAIKANTCVLT